MALDVVGALRDRRPEQSLPFSESLQLFVAPRPTHALGVQAAGHAPEEIGIAGLGGEKGPERGVGFVQIRSEMPVEIGVVDLLERSRSRDGAFLRSLGLRGGQERREVERRELGFDGGNDAGDGGRGDEGAGENEELQARHGFSFFG